MVPDDLKVAVAAGLVPGWRRFRKFGMNTDVDTGTEQVWPLGTIKVLPTAAATASVVSSSAADGVGGTGARTVIFQGLDANYDEVQEEVTMDGITPVVTTTSWLRMNVGFAADVGSGGINAGNITASIGGNAQVFIEANEGQSHQLDWCVPAGHTYLIDVYSTIIGDTGVDAIQVLGQIRLYDETAPTDNYQSWRTLSDLYMPETSRINTGSVTAIPQKTDIRALVTTNGNNHAASQVIDGYLVRNDTLGAYQGAYAT